MAATDVIFRIGTLGISRAQAEFGIIAVALAKLAQGVKECINAADEWADIWGSMPEEAKKGVQAMDAATKGFISGLDSMKVATKLTQAGISATSEQMAALAKIATDASQKDGSGIKGANEKLNMLTDSLIRGTDKGLKGFGVQLESTGTLAQKQAEIFAKLEAKAKDLNIEVTGLDDKFEILNKRIDDAIGITYNYSSNLPIVGGALDSLNAALSNYTNNMEESKGKFLEYMDPFDRFSDGLVLLEKRFQFAIAGMTGFTATARRLKEEMLDIYKSGVMGSMYDISTTGGEAGYSAKEAAMHAGRAAAATGVSYSPSDAATPYIEGKKKSTGGGGRAKAPEAIGSEGTFIEGGTSIGVTELGPSPVVTDLLEEAKAREYNTVIIMSELDALRQKYVQIGLEHDEMERWYELERDYADENYEIEQRRLDMQYEQMFLMERQVTASDALKNAIRSSAVHMSASTAMMQTGWNMTTKAMQMGVRAAIEGKKGFAKALKDMVADMLASLAELAAVQAIVELAEAIGCFARQDYVAAPQHLAAMAAWIAVGVAAGAASAALSRSGGSNKASSTVSSGKAASSSSNSGYEGAGYGGGESTVVKIYVEGTLSSLFNSLRVESEKQRMSGAYDGGL
jgi:hypothetical protein